MQILVITAVLAEQETVLRGLRGDKRFNVVAAGVGPVAAAVSTTKALVKAEYGLVICMGIGGGFPGKAEVESLVLADEIIAADLGVETPQGYNSLDELGLGPTRIIIDRKLLKSAAGALQSAVLPVITGPILTVSTVTGTAETAAELTKRVPGAAGEAMEGYGVARSAMECGVPVLELRAVSNLVGPRDRAAWRVKEALDMLEKASTALLEVL